VWIITIGQKRNLRAVIGATFGSQVQRSLNSSDAGRIPLFLLSPSVNNGRPEKSVDLGEIMCIYMVRLQIYPDLSVFAKCLEASVWYSWEP
jgi:hypothetical protein